MNNDMIVYQKMIKENISSLINQNRLDEAKELLDKYVGIVKDDIEVYSIKGVIAIMEGKMGEAEEVLKEGIKLDNSNFDLLYNLAYLYQLQDNHAKAYEFYNRSKEYANNLKLKTEVEEALGKLKYDNSIYPKVTIIIPSYNQKDHLKEAVESCLKQDYPNLEILVGDDCSTDGTHEMMLQYEKISKIKYIRNCRNLGAGDNTSNLFYNHTNSKYGMILNHDDYLIKNDYISTAVQFMEKNTNVSLVWANCKIKNEISREESKTNFENKGIIKGIQYFINYEKQGFPHITGKLTSVFNLEKYKSIECLGEKHLQNSSFADTILYLKLMLVGDVGFIDECVSVYRVHNEGISFNMPRQLDIDIINEYEEIKNYVLNKGILNVEQTENWINTRVTSYIFWRFSTLWRTKKKRDALELLMSISKSYPTVYERILDNL